VVHVGGATTRLELVRLTTDLAGPASTHGARVMAVAAGSAPPATVTGAVVALLSTGTAGEVVQLGDG
jgi:citrate synthase